MRFNVRYFLVCELRERGERTWTTPLIKNTFVGFFVSTPPFFFPPLPSPLSAPAVVAVINVNFLIRIPTITRDVSRNDESNERGGKIGTTLNEKRKKK